MEDCKFTDGEIRAINNCIRKLGNGLNSISSIQSINNPIPIEHDNFILFRIGLALDAAILIDTAIDRIKRGIKFINTNNNFTSLNSVLFPCSILMRTILRRVIDLSFLWKYPVNTTEYRDHQLNGDSGEWAYKRLGINYQQKTEQGIIVVINEIVGISLSNDDFRKKSDHFNDNYYAKHAIERYQLLHNSPLENEKFIRKTKGNIIQCIVDCYEYVDLIIKGFEKYEQVTINNTDALDSATDKDTWILRLIRKQYQYSN